MQFVCSFLHYSVTNLQSQKKKNVTMPKINVRIFTVLISMGRSCSTENKVFSYVTRCVYQPYSIGKKL